MDAGHVPAVPLLRGARAIQRHPRLHRRLRVDDGLRQLQLLLRARRLQRRALRANDVAPQLLRVFRVRGAAQRLRVVLHLPHAHALHARHLRRAGRRRGAQPHQLGRGPQVRRLHRRGAHPLGRARRLPRLLGTIRVARQLRGPAQAGAFDTPVVAMGSLSELRGLTSPCLQDDDPLHEWFFRSGLDRFVWIYGMVRSTVAPHSLCVC